MQNTTVLNVVGGLDFRGGTMAYVVQLASISLPEFDSRIWKHCQFRGDEMEHLFVSRGKLKKTDVGIIADFFRGIRESFPLCRWIKEEKTVILHAHSRTGIIASCIASKRTGCPLIIHMHFLPNRPWIYRFLQRWTKAVFVFNCAKTCRHFDAIPQGSHIIMPLIKWPLEFKMSLKNQKVRFVAAAMFSPIKRIHLIIEAFNDFQRFDSKAELIVFGLSPNPLAPQYQNRIISLAASNPAIKLMGYDPQWIEQTHSDDIFIHAADKEAFGIVILEAFARGLKIVAPEGTFLDELPAPQNCAGIYPARGQLAQSFATQMQKAVSDQCAPESLFRTRQAISAQFSREATAEKLLSIYRSCKWRN